MPLSGGQLKAVLRLVVSRGALTQLGLAMPAYICFIVAVPKIMNCRGEHSESRGSLLKR